MIAIINIIIGVYNYIEKIMIGLPVLHCDSNLNSLTYCRFSGSKEKASSEPLASGLHFSLQSQPLPAQGNHNQDKKEEYGREKV